jgi:hypothetical protein
MITRENALQIAKNVLQKKNIPFREISIKQKLITSFSVAKWHVLFNIPMPLGMQDEYFTVVINAETGISEGIITPTTTLEGH